MNLRRWQAEALPLAIDAVKAGRKSVIHAVMGAGKSVLIAEVLRACPPPDGWKHVVTAPKQSLVRQLCDVIDGATPFFADAKDTSGDVIVTCNPSVPHLPPMQVALWVADEAHRAVHVDSFAALGFTATPYTGLAGFDSLLYSYNAQDAIQDGVVVPPDVRHWKGKTAEVDEIIVKMIKRHTVGPGLVNAATIADAEAYAAYLTDNGIEAAAIHSQNKPHHRQVLHELEHGPLRCLVHVDLLTEGVNLPWLRWLAMRRPRTSRVAFCQEVGRVLRAHPGKDSAVILDPLDLFNEFDLDYEAIVGMEVDEKTEVERAVEALSDLPRPGEPMVGVPLDALASYLRKAALELYALGLARREIKTRGWRLEWVSSGQQAWVSRHRHIIASVPEPHANILRRVVEANALFNRGDFADLITILKTTERHGWRLSCTSSAA